MDKEKIWHQQHVGKLEKLKLLSTFTTPLNKLDLTRISKTKTSCTFLSNARGCDKNILYQTSFLGPLHKVSV